MSKTLKICVRETFMMSQTNCDAQRALKFEKVMTLTKFVGLRPKCKM